ncbi:ROK family protein [Haloferula sp. A504]|uniref:ROK family protein n=1 Tax=Haloferula sp. A504 TaxID=3373601 RepID=UPI0031C93DB9|nr:ROK family protein [Verrucomicrobiaceae bacterium E54]
MIDEGCVVASTVVDSMAHLPSAEWFPTLDQAVTDLCRTSGVRRQAIDAMVWALPLIIDPGLRRATRAFGKFEDVTDEDFCSRAEERFGLPLLLDGDARAAAIGEWQAGAGKGSDDLVMITLGTGIGTGVIQNGYPVRGRTGMAGTLGGLSITHLGSPGSDRVAPGCTEGQVATWALPERVAAHPEFGASSLSNVSPVDYQALFSHAAQGDPLACTIRDHALEAWGALTLNLIQAFDPGRVVIGGGIMAAAEIILPPVRRFVRDHAIQPGGPVEIVAGTLGDHAALIGCEWIWNHASR